MNIFGENHFEQMEAACENLRRKQNKVFLIN